MPLYADLVGALGSSYGSDKLTHLLAALPTKKSLHKRGGFRASLTFKKQGLYLIFGWQRPEWLLTSAILYPGGVEGFQPFPDPIEGVLSVSSDRSTVRKTLGNPSRSGGSGAVLSASVLIDYPWDRYDMHAYSIRFDYQSAEGAVHIVSLMSSDTAARFK